MDRRYVGIDLHRRRSVIFAMDAEGERLFCERIDNDSLRLLEVVSAAGEDAEVVIEATWSRQAPTSVARRNPGRRVPGPRQVLPRRVDVERPLLPLVTQARRARGVERTVCKREGQRALPRFGPRPGWVVPLDAWAGWAQP
jgi:hypothetical protein